MFDCAQSNLSLYQGKEEQGHVSNLEIVGMSRNGT